MSSKNISLYSWAEQLVQLGYVRKKNEDEAAKRKADDDKFYAEKIENEGLEAQKVIDAIMDRVSKKDIALEDICKTNNEGLCHSKDQSGNSRVKASNDFDIEKDFQCMGSVVSDLNSFLVSTRKRVGHVVFQKVL